MQAKVLEKARVLGEAEFYATAVRLYRAGFGLFAIMAVMYAAWTKLERETGPEQDFVPLDM